VRFRRPSRPESYALDTAPYKVLRCAPTTRIARGSRLPLSSCRPRAVGVRETLTAPRPSAAPWQLRDAGRLGPSLASRDSDAQYRVLQASRRAKLSQGLDIGTLQSGEVARRDLTEDLALRLGLSFRVLAPMRNRSYMRGVAGGIDAMAKEKAAYWLGMAMPRRRPRRVLSAPVPLSLGKKPKISCKPLISHRIALAGWSQ